MGKSPSSMLLDHGVANPNKEEGEFKVSFAVSSLDRFFDDKADILEQEGLTTEMTFTLKADGTLDEYLLPFMRLVCIQSFDAFLLESVFRQEVWGFVNLPVSKDNEKLMLETLIATFEGALDDIGSSESEDMSIVRDASSTYRQVQAAYVRIGERSALKKTIYLLEQEMEEMDSKEYYQERRLKSLNLDRPVDESEIVDPNVEFGRERDAPWMR
ncbi:hypothetical protein GUITHDRAFT_84758 [Guillardia theta CCMP2712]|uniref:Rubisco LSMT substrate-binding domain-containing protein n=3 Tax=Guillardia theta TaxID=55529 RepID=L1JVQ5_GUITC|nr:hypothetical protein GUITHDRAFT_84758 [Guillardia theta CCMP2712]EKX52183.1 hypothetical protein GUITHDRAFT_84758 [Guillardia theta CCMP2712]|eukprot:XP_005839163.1 hypothetical protein GUITHDRAFT_84758 [Guillardia theta CCMP2712]